MSTTRPRAATRLSIAAVVLPLLGALVALIGPIGQAEAAPLGSTSSMAHTSRASSATRFAHDFIQHAARQDYRWIRRHSGDPKQVVADIRRYRRIYGDSSFGRLVGCHHDRPYRPSWQYCQTKYHVYVYMKPSRRGLVAMYVTYWD